MIAKDFIYRLRLYTVFDTIQLIQRYKSLKKTSTSF